MLPKKIVNEIYWVGAIDRDMRNFHGYLTQRGSTYNSFLIVDEKVVLVDNVKENFGKDMIKRVSQIIEPAKIDYIIQNHIEPDHSGSLPEIMELCPNATILAAPKGVEGLQKHYHTDWNYQAVKSGDTLNIGTRNLHFVQTPMVHWPDNMVTYCPEEKVLFSNDAFGQHVGSTERFDDEYPFDIVMHEAMKYYANIVTPYGRQVQKALEVINSLDVDLICPSHGLVWRSHIPEIIEEYTKWAANEVENKALIIYDTMWKSTEKIAHSVQEAFEEKGCRTMLFNIRHNHISDIMTEILTAKYICVGSPTLNNNILPTVAAFLTYLKGLAPKGRIGMAFGSYGWGGQSVKIVEEELKSCGFEMFEKVRIQYIPTEEMLEKEKNKIIEQIV